MICDLRNEINSRKLLVSKISKMAEDKLKSYPKGKIHIRRYKSNVYYYFTEDNDRKEKILGKDDIEIANALIQKNYLEKVKRVSEKELEALYRIKKLYPDVVAEEVYDLLSEERKMIVKPIVPTDEQFVSRWLKCSYDHKPIPDDIPFYQTMNGERVRSKSEMIIADRLYTNGIPYKYECPLLVGENEIIHPDFTILRLSDRKIIYYEYCGRMDDPGYAEDMVERAKKYALSGILQGDRLFYTFETSTIPLDVRVLDNMITNNFK